MHVDVVCTVICEPGSRLDEKMIDELAIFEFSSKKVY